MNDSEIWERHMDAFPKIRTWPEEKRETARKAYLAGYHDGTNDVKKDSEK